MKISNRIKELRNYLKISTEEFAANGGVSARSQQMYESGKTMPTAEYCAAIAESYKNISLDWLLTGEGTMLKGGGAGNDENVSPKKRELMRLLERLDENALDDAIYSTKKLVENFEMKMMLQKLTAQQGQQQRMAA